jgi:hypothetical protein
MFLFWGTKACLSIRPNIGAYLRRFLSEFNLYLRSLIPDTNIVLNFIVK